MLGSQDTKVVEEQGEKVTEKTLMAPLDEKDFHRLAVARTLGINNFDEIKDNRERIDRVLKWAEMKGAKNYEDIIMEIKQVKNIMGMPNLHEVSVYVGLDMDRLETLAKMNKMV